jgi:hypothetical protein
MSERSQERFVPSGVNAQSWLGFEQRIQERRFRALLDTIDRAIAAGDAAAARVAFEEARELRPAAPELIDVEERITAVPLVAGADGHAVWSRALGAVMMLLVGVSLLIGIDWLRANTDGTTALPPVVSPDLRIAAPVPATTAEEPAVTIVPPPPVEDLAPAPQEVGTTGLERQIRAVGDQPRLRTASTIETGEIPDDFVFMPPSPRLAPMPAADARPSTTPLQPAARAAAPPPAARAAAPTSIARDETRVAAVLDQYARAYGRLDAGAAREVWPSVDERALARAFDNLASQSVSFDDCAIDVQGATANASCRGTTSYVGKVGSREPRIEPRTWRFELRRDGEAWKIASAEARRQ